MDRMSRMHRSWIPVLLVAAGGAGFTGESPALSSGQLESALRGCPNLQHQFPEGTPRHAVILDGVLAWSGDDLSESGLTTRLDDSVDDSVNVTVLCPPFVGTSFDVVVHHASIVIYARKSGVQGIWDDLSNLQAAQDSHRASTGDWARSLDELAWDEGSPGITLRFEGAPEAGEGWRAVATHPAYFQSCAVGAGFGANPARDREPDAPYCEYLDQRVNVAPSAG
jgi:hypothetical protein